MSDIAFSVIIKNDGIDDIIFKTIMLKGDKGNSVASVEKTSTSGLVDTYTIYLTDGTVGGTFNVTNGAPVNIDDSVTASDKTWSSSKLSGMIKSIDDSDVDADKLWSSQKIDSMIAQTETIEDVAIASFSDGADDVPVSELIVDIKAVQAGSGVPSPDNEREILGFDSGIVTRTSENVFDMDNWLTSINENHTVSGNVITLSYITLKPYNNPCVISDMDKPFFLSVNEISGNATGIKLQLLNSSNNVVAQVTNTSRTASGVGCKIRIDYGNGGSVIFNNPIVSDYGNTYEFAFGQTVYGGHFDNKGNLLVTNFKYTNTWANGGGTTNLGDYTRKRFTFSQPNYCKYPPTTLQSQKCDIAPYKAAYNENSLHFYCDANGVYLFLPNNTEGSQEFTIIGELVNPITLAITSQDVAILLGNNNIFADTGNINKLVYFKTGSEAVASIVEACTPAILSGQVQSDWNENESDSKAYIKNKPTIPPAQVNADWDASSGVAEILNKPTIPVVDQTLNPSSSNAISNSAVVDGLSLKANKTTDTTISVESGYTLISSSCGKTDRLVHLNFNVEKTGGFASGWQVIGTTEYKPNTLVFCPLWNVTNGAGAGEVRIDTDGKINFYVSIAGELRMNANIGYITN